MHRIIFLYMYKFFEVSADTYAKSFSKYVWFGNKKNQTYF